LALSVNAIVDQNKKYEIMMFDEGSFYTFAWIICHLCFEKYSQL
jgi:hypothetical protein